MVFFFQKFVEKVFKENLQTYRQTDKTLKFLIRKEFQMTDRQTDKIISNFS